MMYLAGTNKISALGNNSLVLLPFFVVKLYIVVYFQLKDQPGYLCAWLVSIFLSSF